MLKVDNICLNMLRVGNILRWDLYLWRIEAIYRNQIKIRRVEITFNMYTEEHRLRDTKVIKYITKREMLFYMAYGRMDRTEEFLDTRIP